MLCLIIRAVDNHIADVRNMVVENFGGVSL